MKRFKMVILNWLVNGMFKGLREEDVFKILGGFLYINGEKVTNEQSGMYRDQALKILDSNVWKILVNKITYQSEEIMFQKSKTTDDLFFGKVMLYNLDLLNKYLIKISKIK